MKDFIEGVFSSVLAVLPSIYSRQACGMGAAHRLKSHRRNRRCAGKQYKKSHQGNEWKKPFSGSSHARGIVLEKIGIEVKQPNSAIRKCARVEPIKNRQKMVAFVSNYGCLNFIEENVLLMAAIEIGVVTSLSLRRLVLCHEALLTIRCFKLDLRLSFWLNFVWSWHDSLEFWRTFGMFLQ